MEKVIDLLTGLLNPLSFLFRRKTIKISGRPVYLMVTKAPLIACVKLDPVFCLSQQSDIY